MVTEATGGGGWGPLSMGQPRQPTRGTTILRSRHGWTAITAHSPQVKVWNTVCVRDRAR
jgi:hypothetical protein